jgi:NADH-quinone oxidoreductase subunit J
VERALFYFFGGLTTLASLWMITRRNPMTSALSLVVAFIGLAGLFAVLSAHLLFVVQIWVYAGAIMVLVLFVIKLLTLREEEARVKAMGYGRLALGAVVVIFVAFKAFVVLASVRTTAPPVSPEFGSVASVSELLFSRYILQFEMIGVLLLAVTVAVVVMAKRRF